MWTSIIKLIVRVVNLFIDRKVKNESPAEVELQEKQALDNAIVSGDSNAVNIILERRMRRDEAEKRAGSDKLG